MKFRNCLVVGVCLALPNALFADFEYQETTKITGGSIVSMMKLAGAFSKQARQAGEPVVSTVVVKGNRMLRMSKDSSEIVDLDKETITHIDNLKHEYTVMTFEEMKQQIEKAQREAEQKMKEHKTEQESKPQPSDTQVTFEAHVRNTGAKKQVAGLDSDESILTMEMQAKDKTSGQAGSMDITNDMWLAKEIPGYEEVRDFDRRYAIKMGEVFSGVMNPSMLAMHPGMGQGMADMAKEMSKLKGVPVQQIMRMGSTADGKPLPAASEAPLPPSNSPEMPSVGDVAQQSATSAIASKLGFGGLGGFGHKKKADPPPQDQPPAQNQGAQGNGQAAAMVLIETSTELSSFSSNSIDPSRFEVPAGYKLVKATEIR
jgi:hypothetical protein